MPQEKRWYLLACLHCRPLLIMPFGKDCERGQWASAHRHGTGHNNWFVTQVRSRAPTAIEDPVDKIAEHLFGPTPQGQTDDPSGMGGDPAVHGAVAVGAGGAVVSRADRR